MTRSPRALLVRAVATAALVTPLVLTSTPAQAVTAKELAQEVITRVNAERAKVGCGPLRWSSALQSAAQWHSYDMRTKNYFSHTSKDGRSPFDRMADKGYLLGTAENIAAGQQTPKAVVAAWMNSSGHRANILNCRNKAVGVGVSRGASTYGIYWTQDFGSR